MESTAATPNEKPPYICKNCGGTLTFSPETGNLTCQYCQSEVDIEIPRGEIVENDYDRWSEEFKASSQGEGGAEEKSDSTEAFPGDDESNKVLEISCTQCGATTTFDPSILSQLCPFCGSALTASDAHLATFWEPNYIIPFAISQRGCGKIFEKWARKSWLAPETFRKRSQLSDHRFSGVYLPYWTYDADVEADYSGLRGDREYYEDSDGTRKSRMEWTSVSGTVYESFDDVLVPAVESISRDILSKASDWDQEDYKIYTPHYLAGFQTQIYSIDFVAGFEYAYEIMDDSMRALAKRDIGGDSQKITSLNMEISNRTFKLLVLPFWISSYRYKEKVYQVVINGRSGKIYGKKPTSWIKVTILVILSLVLLIFLWYWMGLDGEDALEMLFY